jgi:hypothetical protein
MEIELGKNYRTRDGREVRVYSTDNDTSILSVHGAYWTGLLWNICEWLKTGSHFADSQLDLIECRPRIKREVWVNVYRLPGTGDCFESKHDADRYGGNRIACVKLTIDCDEGEGL